jgi:hypothetical protein
MFDEVGLVQAVEGLYKRLEAGKSHKCTIPTTPVLAFRLSAKRRRQEPAFSVI